jgi:hypothetical protein
LLDIAIPDGVDAGEVFRFNLQDGMSAQDVIGRAATLVGAVNESLMTQYGGLLYLTNRLFARYRQGESSRRMTPKKSEFAGADPVRSDLIGHMLPQNDYEDATAWTPLYLRDADREQIDADLFLVAESWRNRIDYDVINRMLTTTENQIGDSGYDVPWAIGTGVNVAYIPPQWGAHQFDSTHTHFEYVNSSTSGNDHATLLNAMADELRHHGHTGRLVALVSDSDLDSYAALDKFVELNPAGFQIITGGDDEIRTVTGEMQGVPGELFGYFKATRGIVELRYHGRIPANYAFMTRSYGVNSPMNGLAIREHARVGFGLQVKPQITRDIRPELEMVKFTGTHGVGVNDRTNGVAGYIADGASAYVNPTIS